MSKAVITPNTLAPAARRLHVLSTAPGRRLVASPAIPAALDARLVRLPRPLAVQFARPVDVGAPVVIDGVLIATMHARGIVHHYRVVADGVVWLVPPVWLTSASREAIAALPRAPAPDLATRVRAALDELVREHLA